jgi:hypothetical protein
MNVSDEHPSYFLSVEEIPSRETLDVLRIPKPILSSRMYENYWNVLSKIAETIIRRNCNYIFIARRVVTLTIRLQLYPQ